MMSIHFNALIDTFHYVPRKFSERPFIYFFDGTSSHFRNSTFYWRLPSKFFKETLPTAGVRHRF